MTETTKPRNQIIKNLPAADYHAAPEIGSSALKTIHTQSPKAYHAQTKGETDAMRSGTAVHLAIGQPELFEEQVVAFDGTRRGKAWEKFQKDNASQTILKQNAYDDIAGVAAAVRGHPVAGPLLDQVTDWEVSLFWDGYKARLDGLAPDFILEIKSAANAAPQLFAAQCARLGYHLQFAQYLDGACRLIDPRLEMKVIVVEKVAPYEVAVYEMGAPDVHDDLPEDVPAAPDGLLEIGRTAYREARAIYDQCMASGHWPGAYEDGPLELRLPRWAEPEKEELKRADYSGLDF
jgi:exodeoxyribonuclease VIII